MLVSLDIEVDHCLIHRYHANVTGLYGDSLDLFGDG